MNGNRGVEAREFKRWLRPRIVHALQAPYDRTPQRRRYKGMAPSASERAAEVWLHAPGIFTGPFAAGYDLYTSFKTVADGFDTQAALKTVGTLVTTAAILVPPIGWEVDRIIEERRGNHHPEHENGRRSIRLVQLAALATVTMLSVVSYDWSPAPQSGGTGGGDTDGTHRQNGHNKPATRGAREFPDDMTDLQT